MSKVTYLNSHLQKFRKKPEIKIDLKEVNAKIVEVENKSAKALEEHNGYLKELGLDTI